jgi:transcriptional regulator with XRE-family HTH domain
VAVLRQTIGETLRGIRLRQRRTLREVSTAARVSLGYLSEIERGQKEPSSELLAAICSALDVSLSGLFREVSDSLHRSELADRSRVATASPSLRPALGRPSGPQVRTGSTVAA